jgi:tRNA pseudouridine32 synthase/23S rRNA pseudouridine746 synthase
MLLTQYFDVIDNNDDFIVINKYSNVDFHCSDEGLGIVAKVSQSLGGVHLFPVHRLDKMTSGLLVMAKSSAIAAKFGELFERRKVSKYYIAISDQKPKKSRA